MTSNLRPILISLYVFLDIFASVFWYTFIFFLDAVMLISPGFLLTTLAIASPFTLLMLDSPQLDFRMLEYPVLVPRPFICLFVFILRLPCPVSWFVIVLYPDESHTFLSYNPILIFKNYYYICNRHVPSKNHDFLPPASTKPVSPTFR